MKDDFYLERDRDNGIDILKLETTPDSAPRLWALYKPEERLNPNDKNIYLWIRRIDYLFLSEDAAKQYLNNFLKGIIVWQPHELFPELQVGKDNRNYTWYLEPVPLRL